MKLPRRNPQLNLDQAVALACSGLGYDDLIDEIRWGVKQNPVGIFSDSNVEVISYFLRKNVRFENS